MPKYASLEEYVNTFNQKALRCYNELKKVTNDIPLEVKERLFAGQVAFYVEETLKRTFHESPVIVLAFFQDHVNIFASKNKSYQHVLKDYTFTEKHTMQIYYDKPIHNTILAKLFFESLH